MTFIKPTAARLTCNRRFCLCRSLQLRRGFHRTTSGKGSGSSGHTEGDPMKSPSDGIGFCPLFAFTIHRQWGLGWMAFDRPWVVVPPFAPPFLPAPSPCSSLLNFWLRSKRWYSVLEWTFATSSIHFRAISVWEPGALNPNILSAPVLSWVRR